MADIPSATSLGVSVSTDVGDVAIALASLFKFSDDLLAILNSPAMLVARRNVDVQKALDQIARNATEALKTGDVSEVDKDLS